MNMTTNKKTYQFSRLATYVQYGIVTASSKEEAIQLIKDGEEDDIFDISIENYDNESIRIEDED